MDFKITPDNIIQTPTMVMSPKEEEFNYLENDELQILELPYKEDKLSMLILLPKNDISSFEAEMSLEKLNDWKKEMNQTSLSNIYLPKFEFDTKNYLSQDLNEMGMPSAFGDFADFSKMTTQANLFISNVIHQAYIKVDEEGTEAAAATVVIMDTKGMAKSIVFKADKPFVFLIQEKDTGNILFMGRVIDPSSK